MLSIESIEYLKLIFSDADLIDVDFSHWDNLVSLYVVADHVRSTVQGKRAIIALRFQGVRRFEWSFRHHTFDKFPLKEDPEQHLNWNIYRIELKDGSTSELIVSGAEQFPVLRIEFLDVSVERIDPSVFTDVNPDWSNAGTGLARPSIEQLHKLFMRK